MLTNNDLLVLGFLLERPMHGYEINQALKTEDIGIWFEISTAAIYYSLNKLQRLSLIAEAHSRGSSGDKTIYHVTDSGREAFLAGLESLLTSEKPIHSDYDLGVFMLNRLPKNHAMRLLENRITFLRQLKAQLEIKHVEAKGQLLKQAILQHSIAIAQLDVDWLADITQQFAEAENCGSDYQSLMSLNGNLRDFHLPDLIKLIESGNHSGTLVLNSGPRTCSITFENGQPHCAASQVSNVSVEDTEQVMEHIYQLFRWQEGDFVFDQRGCPQNGCRILTLSSDLLILEAARRLESWDVIQRIVASAELLFERSDLPGDKTELLLSESELHILALTDGTKDVTAIARASGFTEFETSKTLYGLYAVGYVRPADPDKSKLRRVFREYAELMCRGALPISTKPDEASACEDEVNKRCADLPVRLRNSSIEDQTSPSMATVALADVYRTFIQTQYTVLSLRFGRDTANVLRQQVLSRISPDLREIIELYGLI